MAGVDLCPISAEVSQLLHRVIACRPTLHFRILKRCWCRFLLYRDRASQMKLAIRGVYASILEGPSAHGCLAADGKRVVLFG